MAETSSPRLDSELLRTLYEIKADVSAIKTRQEEDHDRLFGNGQPGELTKLDSRLKAVELLDAEEKGEKASNRRWAGMISALVSALVTWMIETFLHRK